MPILRVLKSLYLASHTFQWILEDFYWVRKRKWLKGNSKISTAEPKANTTPRENRKTIELKIIDLCILHSFHTWLGWEAIPRETDMNFYQLAAKLSFFLNVEKMHNLPTWKSFFPRGWEIKSVNCPKAGQKKVSFPWFFSDYIAVKRNKPDLGIFHLLFLFDF